MWNVDQKRKRKKIEVAQNRNLDARLQTANCKVIITFENL